jgi:membrane fusion protein (multidrug efflux system)
MRIWCVLIYVLLLYYLPPAAMGEYKPGKGERAKPVQVVPAVKQEVIYVAETTGTLVAEADVDVGAEVDAVVKKILFKEGDQVQEGQLLLELDEEKYRLRVEENGAKVRRAEADMDLAIKTLKRKTQLYEEGVIPLQEYDDALATANLARASLETAQASLALAEKEFKDTRLFSPFSGLIGAKYVEEGEYVKEGDKLFNVVKIDPIRVEFYVPEKYTPMVELGKSLGVTVEAYPKEEFIGEIYFVNPKIKTETRRFQCQARIKNPDGRLRPGFFATSKIVLAKNPEAIVIPQEALLAEEGINYCFTVEDGRAKKVSMTVGIKLKEGMVEVINGIVEGTPVVVRGQHVLVEGDRVEPKLFKVAGESKQ